MEKETAVLFALTNARRCWDVIGALQKYPLSQICPTDAQGRQNGMHGNNYEFLQLLAKNLKQMGLNYLSNSCGMLCSYHHICLKTRPRQIA